jgi:hypothetical protein
MIGEQRAGYVLVTCAALCTAVCLLADFAVTEKGLWPTNWPKELEPLRKQSRTLEQVQMVVYEVRFTDREEFEAAWPHILAVKSPEAPIIVLKSPDQRLGRSIKAGVRVLAPQTGSLFTPNGGLYPPSAEGVVTNVPLLKIGPPWPDDLKSKSGALPECVIYDNGRWAPYLAPVYELFQGWFGTCYQPAGCNLVCLCPKRQVI